MVYGNFYCELTAGYTIHRGTMVLREDDGTLSGKMFPGNKFFAGTNFRGGKVDGNKFSFTATWGTPAQSYSMEVAGEVDGDVVTGTATTPDGEYKLNGKRA